MYQDNRPWRHLYNYRWRQLAKRYLLDNPLCAICLAIGKVTKSEVVDHITPHKGNEALFWSTDNLQACCRLCHNSHKAKQENSGVLPGNTPAGEPLDSEHPWYK